LRRKALSEDLLKGYIIAPAKPPLVT